MTREEAFSDEFPAGQIMETSPARGTVLKKNDSVVLTVSKGPESITVISFVGMTYTQAKAQAEELGLKVGAPEYRYYDPTAREGDVIEQSIAPLHHGAGRHGDHLHSVRLHQRSDQVDPCAVYRSG